MRLAGDTDHWTKLEIGAKSCEQKRVRRVEAAGGGKRAKDRGSEIRDVASRAAAVEEMWKSWEHQMDVYSFPAAKLDDCCAKLHRNSETISW